MWEMEGDGGGWRGEGRSKQERKYCAFKGMFVREHACIQTTNKTARTHARTHAPPNAKLSSAPGPIQHPFFNLFFGPHLHPPRPLLPFHPSPIRDAAPQRDQVVRCTGASGVGGHVVPPSFPSFLVASVPRGLGGARLRLSFRARRTHNNGEGARVLATLVYGAGRLCCRVPSLFATPYDVG